MSWPSGSPLPSPISDLSRRSRSPVANRRQISQNEPMSHMPVLRVVPLERIRAHEEVDPLRVQRLVSRIRDEGTQMNPMMCMIAPSGELILLDGATRTASLREIGLEHVVVQLVESEDLALETWHHVIRECEEQDVLDAVERSEHLHLAAERDAPNLHMPSGRSLSVRSSVISPNAALAELVRSYVGRRTVSRVTDPEDRSVPWRFPDWAAVVEFPRLTVEDVMKAAVGDDLLPAGVTRFLVPERALRLNLDLTLLQTDQSLQKKQEMLDRLLSDRSKAGRIRRYEETVVILDD